MQIFQMYIYIMNFGQALDSSIVYKYKTFRGRACRAEWYYFHLFQFLMTLLVSFVAAVILAISVGNDADLIDQAMDIPETELGPLILEEYGYIVIYPLVFINLLLFLPSISVTVRRLQDLNITYFWALPYFITTILGFYALFAGFEVDVDVNRNQEIINAISLLIFLFYLLFFAQKGNYKNNRFGENPLEKES